MITKDANNASFIDVSLKIHSANRTPRGGIQQHLFAYSGQNKLITSGLAATEVTSTLKIIQ